MPVPARWAKPPPPRSASASRRHGRHQQRDHLQARRGRPGRGVRALGTQSAAVPFDNAREPLGQVFHPVAGGSDFLFVVNHFKSKGSAGPWPGDADTGDGQGCVQRVAGPPGDGTARLGAHRAGDAGTKGVFMVGDYNSYPGGPAAGALQRRVHRRREEVRPRRVLVLVHGPLRLARPRPRQRRGAGAGDRCRHLEHQLPGVDGTEYSRYNYTATDFFQPDPYASSDHDPVVVGLAAGTPTETVQMLGINDFHGRIARQRRRGRRRACWRVR